MSDTAHFLCSSGHSSISSMDSQSAIIPISILDIFILPMPIIQKKKIRFSEIERRRGSAVGVSGSWCRGHKLIHKHIRF
jgi:hypothetical protein